MMSSLPFEPGDIMLEENLFDGWLAVPSIAGFLADEPPTGPSCQPPKQTKGSKSHGDTTNEAARMSNLGVEEDTSQSYEATHSHSHSNNHHHSITSPRENALTTNREARQRRGHTKSRLGCITCKKRKIKVSVFSEVSPGS